LDILFAPLDGSPKFHVIEFIVAVESTENGIKFCKQVSFVEIIP